MAKIELINDSYAESKLLHLFPKAQMTLHKNALKLLTPIHFVF